MRAESFAALLAVLAGCALGEAAPFAQDDVFEIAEDTERRLDVLDNDPGAVRVEPFTRVWADDGHYVDQGARTEHGRVEVLAGRRVLYTPDPDFNGEDGFFYVASNAAGSTRARVTLRVGADSERFGEVGGLLRTTEPPKVYPANLDGDQRIDLVVVDGTELELYTQGADGTLHVVPGLPMLDFSELLVTDLDGDARSDLVLIGGNEHGLTLLRNRARASDEIFEVETIDYAEAEPEVGMVVFLDSPLRSAFPRSATVGDFDGDGELDLAAAFSGVDSVVVHYGIAAAPTRFGNVYTFRDASDVASGDVDADARDELVVTTHGAVVHVVRFDAERRVADGTSAKLIDSTIDVAAVAVRDLNGRDGAEIIVSAYDELDVLQADRDLAGAFMTARYAVDGPSIALGDVVGDEAIDLLSIDPARRALALHRGIEVDGVPSFERYADFPAVGLNAPLHAVDFDADGVLDVLAGRCPEGESDCEVVLIRGDQDES